MQSGVNAIKRTGDYLVSYIAPYLMNHHLKKYFIKIGCVLFYRHQTSDVKTCFQQNRYVFDVIVTSWALFIFCISWNFVGDISTFFEEIKHLRSRAPEKYFPRLLKKKQTQILLKYLFGARGVKFLEKGRENVQILQALRWRFDV